MHRLRCKRTSNEKVLNMPIMFDDGVVHMIRNRETKTDFGRLLCGRMYSRDPEYSDLIYRRGKAVKHIVTCLDCLVCKKGP